MERLTAHARKALTISAGCVLLVVGVALLVLPGPGIPLILAGLALLGSHFAWARRLQNRVQDAGGRAFQRIRRFFSAKEA